MRRFPRLSSPSATAFAGRVRTCCGGAATGLSFSWALAPLKRKNRWLRHGLRTLLVLMTVSAVWLGLRLHEGHKQQRAIAVIEELSGRYFYFYDPDETSADRIVMWTTGKTPRWRLPPRWLRRWVPDDYLADIVWVDLDWRVGYRAAADEDLRAIGALKGLRRLDLVQTDVTDEGLRHLYGCKSLEEVCLMNSKVTAQGARKLQRALPNCQVSLHFR